MLIFPTRRPSDSWWRFSLPRCVQQAGRRQLDPDCWSWQNYFQIGGRM